MAAKFPGDVFRECFICERNIDEHRVLGFPDCGHQICGHCWLKYKLPTQYSSTLCPVCADLRNLSESFVNSAQESSSDAKHEESYTAAILGSDGLLQFNVPQLTQAADLFSVQEDPQGLSQQMPPQQRNGMGIEMPLVSQSQEICGVCTVCKSATSHVYEFDGALICIQCAQLFDVRHQTALPEPHFTHPPLIFFEEHPVQQKSTSSSAHVPFGFVKQQPCSAGPFPQAFPVDDSHRIATTSAAAQQTMQQQNFQQHQQLSRPFHSSQVRQPHPQGAQSYHLFSVQPPSGPHSHATSSHENQFSSDIFQSYVSSASRAASHHSSTPVSSSSLRAITNHPSDLMTNQNYSASLRTCSNGAACGPNQHFRPPSGSTVEDSNVISQGNSPALEGPDVRSDIPNHIAKQLFQEKQFEGQQPNMVERSARSVFAPYEDACHMETFSPFGFQNQSGQWPQPKTSMMSPAESTPTLTLVPVSSQKSPRLSPNDKSPSNVNGLLTNQPSVHSCLALLEESVITGNYNSSIKQSTRRGQLIDLIEKLKLCEKHRTSYLQYLSDQPSVIRKKEEAVCAEIKDHFKMIQEKVVETEQSKLMESHKIAEAKRVALTECLHRTKADLELTHKLTLILKHALESEQDIALSHHSQEIDAMMQRVCDDTQGPFNLLDYKFLPPDEKVFQYISAIGSVASQSEPKSCIIRSEDLHHTVCGIKGKFVVIPQNAANQSVCDEGFVAYITTPDHKEHRLNVDKEGDIYIFYFTFSAKGHHNLMVKIRGHTVAASPYTIQCRERGAYIGTSKGPDAVYLDCGELNRAWGMAINRSLSRLYIADRGNHRVIVCSIKDGHCIGPVEFTFGEEGDGHRQFRKPVSVACSTYDGRVAVVDKDNHRIQVFTEEGQFLFEAGSPTASHQAKKPPGLAFNFPWDVAYSPDGNIAVSDSKNNRIQLLSRDGNFLRTVGESCLLDSVRGVTFDSHGNLYATDFNLHRLVVFAASTSLNAFAVYRVTKSDGQVGLNRPQGICVDRLDNILVADSKNMRVLVFGRELFAGFLSDPSLTNERHFVGAAREVFLHPTAIYTIPNREGSTRRILSVASAPDDSLLCMYQSEERTSSLSNSDESLENGGICKRNVMGNGQEHRSSLVPMQGSKRSGFMMRNGKDSLKNDAGPSRMGKESANGVHGVKNAVWLFFQDASRSPEPF